MAKYLLLKHFRDAPEALNKVAIDQWSSEEVAAHMQFMADFDERPRENGKYFEGQALSPEASLRAVRRRGSAPAGCSCIDGRTQPPIRARKLKRHIHVEIPNPVPSRV